MSRLSGKQKFQVKDNTRYFYYPITPKSTKSKAETMTEQNTLSISELQQKANDGDAQAQFELALCYAKGKDVERNMELAFDWHKKAAEQGHVNAQFALGLYYILNMGRIQQVNECLNKWILVETMQKVNPALNLAFSHAMGINFSGADNDLAFTWLKKAAEQNHAEANYWLGICYRDGIGTECNNELSFECYKKAAEQGYEDAYYWLALCYHEGKGIEQSDELAAEWITKAVEHVKVEPEAYLLLGNLYAHGKGVQQNDELAFKWYEKAAEKGVVKANYQMANYYYEGKIVEKSIKLAEENYSLAAEIGIPEAETQFRIATSYLYGDGVEKDYAIGMKWLINAVQANHAEANRWLEEFYLNFVFPYFSGRDDIEQCYSFAFEWLAAGHKENPGDFEINFGLGVLYAFGKGVERSEEMAVEYFSTCMSDCSSVNDNFTEIFYDFSDLYNDMSKGTIQGYYFDVLAPFFLEENPMDMDTKKINAVLPSLRIDFYLQMGEFEFLREFLNGFEDLDSSFSNPSSKKNFKIMSLTAAKQAQELEEKNKALESEIKQKEVAQKLIEEKNKELNNLIAMFAHNFLGTLQCIRSNAEHENNATIHLKTVKMMSGALTAFSIISADDDKLIEQLKQDNSGETNLLQNLANNLALAVSQLLSKTNKDKIINLYLNYLRKTNQIETEISGEELRNDKDYRKKWQAIQHQWEDEFNALFSENVALSSLQTWLEAHFFPVQITGFNDYNIRFKEYGITDSIFLIVFMETLVNALKYMDVSKNKPLTIRLCKENQTYQLTCENPSAQETGRGTHKGMDFLKSIAKKVNGQFITESTEHGFKSTFIIPAELLE